MTKKKYDRVCVHCGSSPIRVSRVKPDRCCTCGRLQKEKQPQQSQKRSGKK